MAPRDTRSGSGPRSRGTHFGPRREARGPAQRLGAPRPTLRGPRGPCSEGRATPLPDLILGSVAAQPQGPRPAPRCAHRAAQLCAARCRCHGGGGRDRCSKPCSILQRKCVQRRVGFPLPRRSPVPAPARFSPAHCITRSPRCNGCISGFKTFALLRSRRLSESRRPSRHKRSQQPQKSAIKACCEGAGVARAGPSPGPAGSAVSRLLPCLSFMPLAPSARRLCRVDWSEVLGEAAPRPPPSQEARAAVDAVPPRLFARQRQARLGELPPEPPPAAGRGGRRGRSNGSRGGCSS